MCLQHVVAYGGHLVPITMPGPQGDWEATRALNQWHADLHAYDGCMKATRIAYRAHSLGAVVSINGFGCHVSRFSDCWVGTAHKG